MHLFLLRRSAVCVHGQRLNQYEIEGDNLGDALNYLDDACRSKCVLRRQGNLGRNATTVVREVEYTEPAVRGDTSGKVMKPARIKPTGYELRWPRSSTSAT